jgi:hypothetical protein
MGAHGDHYGLVTALLCETGEYMGVQSTATTPYTQVPEWKL